MNVEKLYRYIYNLKPFPSSPFLNPKTKILTAFENKIRVSFLLIVNPFTPKRSPSDE